MQMSYRGHSKKTSSVSGGSWESVVELILTISSNRGYIFCHSGFLVCKVVNVQRVDANQQRFQVPLGIVGSDPLPALE
jgi:hypothetical protein